MIKKLIHSIHNNTEGLGFDGKAEESNLNEILFHSLPKVIHLKNKVNHACVFSSLSFLILYLLFQISPKIPINMKTIPESHKY